MSANFNDMNAADAAGSRLGSGDSSGDSFPAEGGFVRRVLPWIVAVAALLAYLATLNPWLTSTNLTLVAQLNGSSWQPMVSQPVLFLATYPLRWLPASSAPLALNVFAALCASLTLALLVRSVALLPHDRLEQQRLLVGNKYALLSLASAWVPPVLAAIALGLQLTFWENATTASGEILSLLLFAAPVWCLLEYRIDPRPRWLDLASLLCGVAAANNWGMVIFLPLFAVAILRSPKLQFFNLRFLQSSKSSTWKAIAPALKADFGFFARMFLLGAAGGLIILVLPIVAACTPESPVGFWQALRAAAASHKSLLVLGDKVFSRHHEALLLLAAVSLLPLLVLTIRWTTFTGRERRWGPDLVGLAFYTSHAFFLVLCLWVDFDPAISPRLMSQRLGLALPFLPLYYLGALCIGYYSGFFLLIFNDPERRRPWQRALRWTAPKLVYALVGLTLAGLLVKNLPAIRLTNGPYLSKYARLAVSALPAEGAIVLAEDPIRLAVVEAELVREAKTSRYVVVDANAMALGSYRAWLARRHPQSGLNELPGWRLVGTETNKVLEPARVLDLIGRLGQSNRVYHLHSSFGQWMERFYLQPCGLVYRVEPYPPNLLGPPLLSQAELAENRLFWLRAEETAVIPITRLMAGADQTPAGLEGSMMRWMRLKRTLPGTVLGVARWYSGALNTWGVTLQSNGSWSEAAPCFALAHELNPENLPAAVNLQCNQHVLAEDEMALPPLQPIDDLLGKYHSWSQAISANGPFDDPAYCFQLGLSLGQGKLWRQTAQQFDRVSQLVPHALRPKLLLADALNRCQLPDLTLQLVSDIYLDPGFPPLEPAEAVDLSFLEAEAWFSKTNHAQAERLVQSLLEAHPNDPVLLQRAKAAFTVHGSYAAAIRLADQQLSQAPDSIPALLDKAAICMLAGDYVRVIPPLTRLLTLTNSYAGRVNRGLAYAQLREYEAAETDFRNAIEASPASCEAYHGLAELARVRGDTNLAIQYYRQCLSNAAPQSREASLAASRLKELEPPGSKGHSPDISHSRPASR